MPKRTRFTNVTPLPPQVSREVAIAMLHNHDEMIELNPLVIEHHAIKTPRDAPADEFLDCVWQELTDRISYLPGGLMKGKVTYRACFHDLPNGLQTHIYAPMGLEIREKWSIGGSLPGEPPEARELGLNLPTSGLYLREDGDMSCNVIMASFVRKNLDNSHKVLVDRILKKAQRLEAHLVDGTSAGPAGFQKGSHMSQSRLVNSSNLGSMYEGPSSASEMFGEQSIHPALRSGPDTAYGHSQSAYNMSVHNAWQGSQNGAPQNLPQNTHTQQHQDYVELPETSVSAPKKAFVAELSDTSIPTSQKEFVAELPGSVPNQTIISQPQEGSVSELSNSAVLPSRLSMSRSDANESKRRSLVSEASAPPTHYRAYSPARHS